VGPKSFDLLRLDRNRNKITPEEQTSLRGLRIGIVGLSVGHSIAHLLAMEGLCGELRLADFDDIAITNLNRIPVSLLDIGIKKTVAAARRIAEIDPYLPVSIWPTGVTQDNVGQFLDGLDLVIEECDSLDVKVLLREAARERRLPVIMETSDRGLLDVERYDLEPDRDLFHGLLRGADAGAIAGLSARDKVPYVLQILEPDQVSTRAAASLAEVGKTLTTWPQLAGDVTLGAATTAAAVLRLVRDGNLASGRMRIDLDAALDTLADPATSPEDPPAPPVPPAPPTDPLELVAFAASRAPSGGNVQPWRFELSEAAFSVFLDPAKSVSMDVAYRGSYVAIGASLFNARVAAAAQGMLGPTELFPDARFDGPVGILHFDHGSDAALAGLFEPMLNRSTNRKKGTPRPIETQVLDHLGDIGAAESGGLHVLTDRDDLGIAAELLAESDRMRFLTPETHREMMSELRWPGRDSLETGIDVRTLELDGADLAALGIARRADVMAQLADWDAGHALGDNTRSSIASSSALLVMTARGSAPVDFVRCGQALMAVWLAAEVSGLAVHPMSPLFIYAQDEENFHSLVGNRYAARLAALAASFRQLVGLRGDEQLGLVLRLSHAAPTTVRSMRLPLDAVLSPRHADRQAERRHRPSGARVGAPSRYPGTLVAEPPVRIPPAPPPSASPPPPPAPTPGETFNPFDLDFMADPGPLLEYARNHQPVFFSPAVNAWVVTRFEDIDRVLRDPVRFTSKEILSIKDLISPVVADYFADSIPMEGTLIGVDPPEHTKLRRVLQGSLTPGRVKALETVVRGLAQGIVDGIGPAGRADLVGDLAYPLPLSTIARLMGIDDQDMAFFRQVTEDWADLSVAYISGVALEDQMVLARRVMAMHERVLELFAMRRAEPRDDLLSSLVAQQSSEHLSDHELLSLVPGLFLAGHETTANVLANALWHLLRVPGRWQDLVRNPSSVVGVVEEILRLDTSVLGLWRNISVDSEIAGVPVPAGQRLYLAFWSANRDGNRFPEPASFQPGRPAGGLHLAFGRGIHFCIGAPLARLELCTALTVLAESLPGLRLEDGFVPSYKPHFFLRGLAALPARW
jgi:cytochrome P450